MTFQEFQEKYRKTKVEELSSSTSKNPVVSVLVQTYQQKDFIKECLDSILMQETKFDFEILIGEDGSKDGTRQICLDYAKKYPNKLRLILHHPENKIKVDGVTTGNYNAFYNFYNAKGKYVAFCEGDDYWADPLKLQKQVDFLESNPGVGFVYHSFITIDNKGQKIESPEEIHQPKWDITKEELFKGKYHPLLLSICFRNIFTEIPRQMAEVLNVDTFLFSYLGKFGDAKFQPDIEPACYRQHPGGTWSHRMKENKFLSKIITYRGLSRYYLLHENKELYTFYFNRLQSSYKMLIYYYLKNGNLVSASKILSKLLLLRK